jgi:S-methylmethionine-dependent homocysteine/selenocysteine methylase
VPNTITTEERVALVERSLVDHAKSLTAYNDEFAKFGARLAAIEDWRHTRDVAAAREDERDKSLYRRLEEIEKSIEAIEKRMDTTAKDQKEGQFRITLLLVAAVISPLGSAVVSRLFA